MLAITKYWIGSVDADNYNIVRKKEIWGVSSTFETSLRKTSKGDLITFYIHGKILGGVFEITSDVYTKTEVFKGGSYPYVVDLNPLKVPRGSLDEFPKFNEELRGNLNFIKNQKYWSAYFRSPMLEISEADFKTLKHFVNSVIE